MPYAGTQLLPRQIARLVVEAGWSDPIEIVKAVAVCIAESHGYTGAYHDNVDSNGTIVSRDVGLFQINIPANDIGSDLEANLYDPNNNVARAKKLYDLRHWQPWVSYTTGWATFPYWWVWTQAEPHHWAPTGRYLQQALRGVGNYLAEELDAMPIAFLDYRLGVPPKPTLPPADGIGPRPIPNDGKS